MKHARLFSILMLVLAGLMAMSLTACSGNSDDDVDPTQQYKNRIIGYWYSSSGSAYCFSEGGTGYYRSGDVGGDFHWTMTGLQIDMTKVVFYTPYSVWHAEPMSAIYDPDVNTLRIDGRIFTRTKPTPKPGEEPADSVATDTVAAN